MDKTCGTCDLPFKNDNYPSLLYCHECCEYVRHDDHACDQHKERTGSVEKAARDMWSEAVKEWGGK